MEPLANQLRKLPGRVLAMPMRARVAIGVGAAALLALVAAVSLLSSAGRWEYVFTKLTPEDSAASADALRSSGIPYRVEAAGDAIAVPASKVHEARLLLAARGLPRASGVGFELFDKTDLGVSEFTQRVNLQRAIEGELARTIANMDPVREARVHVTMPRRGLLRPDDAHGAAAVILRLEPGRSLGEDEVAGIQHLVAASVPSLAAEQVSVLDQNGAQLGRPGDEGDSGDLESNLQQRIVALLEPVVGPGNVIARVTATLDRAEEEETQSDYNPDGSALRSEHTRNDQQNAGDPSSAGLAGAAANQPPGQAGVVARGGMQRSSTMNDLTRNYEVSGTVTHRVKRKPRLTRLSAAVLINQGAGVTLNDAELKKLTELARRAVGFDEERGDLIEVSTASFVAAAPGTDASPTPSALPVGLPVLLAAGIALLLLALAVVAVVALRRKQRSAPAELPAASPAALPDGAVNPVVVKQVTVRESARKAALGDPERAARLLVAWLEPNGAVDTAAEEKLHAR
ncbi:MAG: flagellar M-ring protein FliF [Deltaproteobacteria bacterium]|nr:flagellar M-ring protein FliF [Deltaproteobacteria bacterium]